MDNFLNNISVLKSTLSDEEVAELIKRSSDFIDTQKRSELSMADLEKHLSLLVLKVLLQLEDCMVQQPTQE